MTCHMRMRAARISASVRQVRFAGEQKLMNLQSLCAPVLEQARAGIELVRRLGARGADIRFGAGLHHENRRRCCSTPRAPKNLQRRIMRGEAHAVGVAGQHLIRVEEKIERLVKTLSSCRPNKRMRRSSRILRKVGSTAAESMVSGLMPSKPKRMARSVQ